MLPRPLFATIALGALLFAGADVRAQEEPFEPDDVVAELPSEEAPRYRPVTDALLAIVELYREEIGPRSIRRCPFVVSCSTLAKEEIDKNGLYGLLVFLDRFFYRENIDAHRHYLSRRSADGALLLDDRMP